MLLPHRFRAHAQIGERSILRRDGCENVTQEDIEVARGTELVRKPFRFRRKTVRGVTANGGPENLESRARTAQRDTHLVQRFGQTGFSRRRLVRHQMDEAMPQHRGIGIDQRHLAVEQNGLRLDGFRLLGAQKCKPPFRLALVADMQFRNFVQIERHAVKT